MTDYPDWSLRKAPIVDESSLVGVRARVVLFTDVVSSTSFNRTYGPRTTEALRRRIAFLTHMALRQRSPEFTKSMGDGVMAVFQNASSAVRAAAALQRSIHHLRQRDDLPPAHVRMGLSAGDVNVKMDGDCYGIAVDEAKRLEARAEPDGILVARVVKELDRDFSGAEYGEPRSIEIDGWSEPVVAFEVDWEALQESLPPPLPLPAEFEDALKSPFPFGDREPSLERIRRHVLGQIDDDRRLLLIAGTSGIGKTRFVSELADNLRVSGDLVLVGHCHDQIDAPLQCFREILNAFCRLANEDSELKATLATRRATLRKLSDQVDATLGPADPAAQPDQRFLGEEVEEIFDGLMTWLTLLAKVQNVIVILEDLHYASQETIDVLSRFASARDSARPAIVGVVDPQLATGRISDYVRSAGGHRDAAVYELAPLTLDAIREMLLALPHRRLELAESPSALGNEGNELAERLHQLSGGLPSLLNLLVREAHDQGVAKMTRDGRWEIAGDLGDLEGLSSFGSVIRSRMERLSASATMASQELAVLGTPVSESEFAAISDLDDAEQSDAIAQLVNARIINSTGHVLRFETEAVERIVRRNIGVARRAEIHERVAAALGRRAVEEQLRPPHATIARHLASIVELTGRNVGPAIAHHFSAGSDALRSGSAVEARSAFSNAEACLDGHDLDGEPAWRARVLLALAKAAKEARASDADRLATRAENLAVSVGEPELVNQSIDQLESFFESSLLGAKSPPATWNAGAEPIADRVFVSYSHADRRWLERLQVHLRPLSRRGIIDLWDDTRLELGDEWREKIRVSLSSARVAILLVSADFLASDFIDSDELPPLLDAAEGRGLRIIPILVGPSQFDVMPKLSKYQAANSPDRPLSLLTEPEQEEVLATVSRDVRRAVGRRDNTGQ